MSLINDALKKAQRQRTEGNTPAPEISPSNESQEPLHRVARREKPAGFRSQLMLIGGGAAAAVILLAVGAAFYFRSPAEPVAPIPKPAKVASAPSAVATTTATASTAPAPSAAAQAPASVPPSVSPVAVPAPQPAIAATPSPTPTTPAETPVTAPAAAASAPVTFVIPTPTPAASTPVVTAPSGPVATAPAATERPKPSTRMIGVIEHFRVGGIRVAGAESKVLMNDHVYRINDVVDFELNIRLTAIEAKALTFEDAHGAIHVRTF